MRRLLGFEDTPLKSQQKIDAARKLASSIHTELQMEALEVSEIVPTAEEVEKELHAASTNIDLDMREFLGINKALQRIQGEFANNLGKLTEITEHISKEQSKLNEMKQGGYSEEQIKEVTDRITQLKEEHSVRLELTSKNKKEFQSQFARIRQTIGKVLHSDTTLAEKTKTLFREQDITIAAVLTASGFIIDVIVKAFGGGGTGGPTPPKKPGGIQECIKDKLKALARLLGKLAGKAAAALPGIIGAILSAVLNFWKSAVGFLAQNTWAFIVVIIGIIGYWLVEKMKR